MPGQSTRRAPDPRFEPPCVVDRAQGRADPSHEVAAACLLDDPLAMQSAAGAGNQAALSAVERLAELRASNDLAALTSASDAVDQARRRLPRGALLELIPDGDPFAALDQLAADLVIFGDQPDEVHTPSWDPRTPSPHRVTAPCGGNDRTISTHPQLRPEIGRLLGVDHWQTNDFWSSDTLASQTSLLGGLPLVGSLAGPPVTQMLDDGVTDLNPFCDFDLSLQIEAFMEGGDLVSVDSVPFTAGTTRTATGSDTGGGSGSTTVGATAPRNQASVGTSASHTFGTSRATTVGASSGATMNLPARSVRRRMIWRVTLTYSEAVLGTNSKTMDLDVGSVVVRESL